MAHVLKADLTTDLREKAPVSQCPRCGAEVIHAIEIGIGARRNGVWLASVPDAAGKWLILGFVRGLIGDHFQAHAEQLKNIHELPDTSELPDWAKGKRWHNHAYICGMKLGRAIEGVFEDPETPFITTRPTRTRR
jgi:hypothetical protein